MRRLPAIALLAVVLSSCGDDTSAPAKDAGGGITWGSSLDDALARSKGSGKPVLLHFYATW